MAPGCRAPAQVFLLGLALALSPPAAAIHGYGRVDSLLERGRGSHARRARVGALRAALRSDPGADGGVRASEVFDRYDQQDPRDQLSGAESATLLKDLGFAAAEIDQVVAEMDANRDSLVDRREFIDYIHSPEEVEAPEAQQKRRQPSAIPTGQPWAAPMPTGKPSAAGAPPRADEEAAAKRLQNIAGRTQDTLVDAIENSQIAEIKRSVFRGLSRLRSASIREYDAIATAITEHYNNYTDFHRARFLLDPTRPSPWGDMIPDPNGPLPGPTDANGPFPGPTDSRERAEMMYERADINSLHHLSDYEGPVSEDEKASFHHH